MGSINSYTTPRVYSSVHNVYTCIQLCAIFVMNMHPLPIAEKVCVLWQRASCIHAVNTGEPPRWGWAEATVLPGGMRGRWEGGSILPGGMGEGGTILLGEREGAAASAQVALLKPIWGPISNSRNICLGVYFTH